MRFRLRIVKSVLGTEVVERTAQRAHWELIGGHGVHWPDIDEDLSADGMLNGVPARRPAKAKTQKAAAAFKALQPTSRARRKPKSRRSSRAVRG